MRPNWFIGFPISAGSWLNEIVRRAPAELRYFHPDDLHITIAFLGRIDESSARAGWEFFKRTLPPSFLVSLDSLMPFGPPDRPSAFSFELKDGKEVVSAYIGSCRSKVLEIAGAEPDPWPPRPHITIARPPRNAPDEVRTRGAAWARQLSPPAISITLDRCALYTWSDDRKRKQFKIVEQATLT